MSEISSETSGITESSKTASKQIGWETLSTISSETASCSNTSSIDTSQIQTNVFKEPAVPPLKK